MARRGSGLRTAIKIVKAIDKANKKAIRESEKRRKQQEREDARREREYQQILRQQERDDAKREREYQQMLRQQEKERVLMEKSKIAKEQKRFKQEITDAKVSYENRCLERLNLRSKFIDQEIR